MEKQKLTVPKNKGASKQYGPRVSSEAAARIDLFCEQNLIKSNALVSHIVEKAAMLLKVDK